MKVTDTHDTAAEHFDYLDDEARAQTAADDSQYFAPTGSEALADLVSATGPVPIRAEQMPAVSA